MVETPAVLRFDADYVEDIAGPGEVRLRLRPLRAQDKAGLAEAFARLSPKSRYRRFFTPKDHLTEAELRYLTELDGHDHFALVLCELDAAGQEGAGVGVARFVRVQGQPDLAEPALAVVDAMQGHGLGRLLLLRLSAAAAERGIRRFQGDFLADNVAVRQLLSEATDIESQVSGAVVTASAPLPDVEPDHPHDEPAPSSTLSKLLRLAASRLVQLRHSVTERLSHV